MGELINGRTPEEIKTGLRIHATWGQCKTCPYKTEKNAEFGHCIDRLTKDVYSLVEHLESERDAALAKVPKWISVKDEFPPKHLRVLLMNGHRMVASGHLTYVKAKCGTSLWCMDGVNRNDVTHWAKLPEPPKEGE